jgi:hypothetical protein
MTRAPDAYGLFLGDYMGLDRNAAGEAQIAPGFERTLGVLCGRGQSAAHRRCRPGSQRATGA